MRRRPAFLIIPVILALVTAAPAYASVDPSSAGVTRLLSRTAAGPPADGTSIKPSISGDRSVVVFTSAADDLVAGDTNVHLDVFAKDTRAHSTTKITHAEGGGPANGDSFDASVSADGRYVVFLSRATNLVAEPTDGTAQVYRYDRTEDVTILVSKSADGTPGNAPSLFPSVNDDGHLVAYASQASNLVTGDTNRHLDVFLYDLGTGTTVLLSTSSSGQAGNNDSFDPSMSSDGRYVAFSSYASNLVGDDRNHDLDVFVLDRSTSVVQLASRTPDGDPGNAPSSAPSISATGRFLTFSSNASDLAEDDGNSSQDVFVRNLVHGTNRLVSRAPSGDSANSSSFAESISANGRTVSFYSYASDLVTGDTNQATDVFSQSRKRAVELVSVAVGGAPANGPSDASDLSANGKIVVYESTAANLVGDDGNGVPDIFRYARP